MPTPQAEEEPLYYLILGLLQALKALKSLIIDLLKFL